MKGAASKYKESLLNLFVLIRFFSTTASSKRYIICGRSLRQLQHKLTRVSLNQVKPTLDFVTRRELSMDETFQTGEGREIQF